MKWYQAVWKTWKYIEKALSATGLARMELRGHSVESRLRAISSRMLNPIVPNPMQIHGHTFYYHPKGFWVIGDMVTENYERDTAKLLTQLLRPGMTFVDVGAHVGYFTLLAARIVGNNGRVYAFEPDPSNRALLLKNIEANQYDGRALILPFAVCSKLGTIDLFCGNLDSSQTSLYSNSSTSQLSVVVESTTLDHFFAEQSWPPIDVIKMDIEGGEIEAMKGMAELCKRNPRLKLIIEFSPGVLRVGGFSPEMFFQGLQNLGFARFYLINKTLEPLAISENIANLLHISQGTVNLLCE